MLSYSADELVCAAQLHRKFLVELHRIGVTTTQQTSPEHSLRRYLRCWLPLLEADASVGVQLVPPPDISWLWHCDRLSPETYQSRFSHRKVPEVSSPVFTFQVQSDPHQETCNLWSKVLPYEPFFLDGNNISRTETNEHTGSAVDMDHPSVQHLLASTTSQCKFIEHISDPRYQNDSFLQAAARRYLLFLQLPPTKLPIIPTHPIDFIWHTHMLLDTERYVSDSIQVRGSMLHHSHSNDWTSNRRPGGTFDQAWQATCQLWKETYPGEEEYSFSEKPLGHMVDHLDAQNSSLHVYPSEGPLQLEAMKQQSAEHAMSRNPPFVGLSSNTMNLLTEKSSLAKYVQRDGYMFGMGPSGLGYYSLEDGNPCLPDALIILNQRLKRRQQALEAELRAVDCRFCFCGLSGYLPKQTRLRRQRLEADINDIAHMRKSVVRAVRGEPIVEGDSPKFMPTKTRDAREGNDAVGLGLVPLWIAPEYVEAAACGGATMDVDGASPGPGCGDAYCCDDCFYM
jgi:hypothetical protein